MWSSDNNQAWPLPSAYQNMSHDQIDWAALAQQWIQMKEVQNSLAPEQNSSAYYAGQGLNGGEAPMEVVKDDEDDDFLPEGSSSFSSAPLPPSVPHPPLPPHPPSYPLMPTRPPPAHFATFPGPNRQAPPHRPPAPVPSNFTPYPGHQHPAAPLRPVLGQNVPGFPPRYAGGPPGHFPVSNVQAPPPAPWPPAYAPMPPRNSAPPARPNLVHATDPVALMQISGLDAHKRKQLPLWIREGLERMERQKQKKEERDLLLQVREEKRKLDLEAQTQLRMQAERDGVILPPVKSKFESDSEEDSKSENGSVGSEERLPKAHQSMSPSPEKSRTPTPEPLPSEMTPDEILQQLMLRVRRMMTEILLEVTNEEIEAVARSVYRKAKSAAPAKVIQPSKALTLGLGEYGSDSEDDEKPSGKNKGSDTESDEELQVRIAKRKREYAAQSTTRDMAAARAERRFARWEKRLRGETHSPSSSEEEKDTKDEEEKNNFETKAEDSHSVRHPSSLVGVKKDIQVEPEANHTTRNDSSKGVGDSWKGKRRRDASSSSSRSRSRSPSRHRRRDHRSNTHKSSGSRRSRSRSKERRRRSKSRSRRSSDNRKKTSSRASRSSERRSRSRSRNRRRSWR